MVGAAIDKDNIVHRMALEDPLPWWKKRNLRFMYLMLFPCCMGIEMTSGFDSQIINAVQLVPAWKVYFGNPQGGLKGILASALPLGACLGLPLIPFVNDTFGRRWCVMFGSIIMIIGSLIQGFSINVPMYIISRFIIGFGLPYAIVAGSSLVGELAYPKERAILTSLFNAAYFIGSITAAGITFGTQLIPSDWSWRVPSLLQMSPSLLQVVFIFLVPESPRYLISKDRHEEAFDILVKYHGEGDPNSEFVKAEMAEIKTTIALELENSKRSWKDVLSTKANRRRILIGSLVGIMTQLSGNVVISYYTGDILNLVGFTDPKFQSEYNLGNQAWQFVSALACAMIVMRYKRRTMYLTAILGILAVYVAWTVSAAFYLDHGPNPVAAKMCLFWIYAYAPFYNLGFNALTYTFLVEIFPFSIRARGITVFQFFGKAAQFFGTNVNPVGLDPVTGIGYKFLIVYCCWIAIEAGLIFWLWPETSGRTLEELAFLFEGDERQHAATIAAEKVIHHEDMDKNEPAAVAMEHV